MLGALRIRLMKDRIESTGRVQRYLLSIAM
jgi:hypothetical protein